jgi:hypothetical protein
LLSVGGSNLRRPANRIALRSYIFLRFGAPGRIRTADTLVRSRKDDLIGSYFSTT